MSNDHTFTVEQAAAANTAMRMALGLPPEQFAVPQFVAMISDEIEELREAGQSDAEIAALVTDATGSPLGADDVSTHYAPPEERGRSGNGHR